MTRVQLAEFRSANGCVVSYCPMASAVGAQILRRGGNAVDAAVATALALAVTYPQAGNLGGGGFMLARSSSGDVHYLDFREVVPMNVKPEIFLDDEHWRNEGTILGGTAVCVPGTVAGLASALERFGTWQWDQVVGLVIDLAEVGVWMTTRQASYVRMYQHHLMRFPTTARTFLRNGEAPLPGTLWPQPDLAWTLRQLADHGPQAFYTGEIADRMVETIQADGGALDHDDLRNYRERWRDPLAGKFFGRTVYTAGPPSGGGLVVLLSTAILEAAGVRDIPPNTPERFKMLARAFRVAFEARRQLTADPDTDDGIAFSRNNEVLRRCISLADDLDALEDYLGLNDPDSHSRVVFEDHKNTTHLCVLDGEGNAVSLTYSLNTLFGSKLVPRGCGFLLNNSIDDFSIGGVPNYYGLVEASRNELVPGRRATGSMAPTLVLDGDKIELILGASGGPRIPTVVVQLLVHVLCDDEILPIAMREPRVHQQHVENEIWVEPTMPDAIQQGLLDLGLEVSRHARLGIGAGIQKWRGGVYAALDFRFSQ